MSKHGPWSTGKQSMQSIRRKPCPECGKMIAPLGMGSHRASHSRKKEPSQADAERCLDIRRQSKRGMAVGARDHDFCMKMFKEYPSWYSKTEMRIFEETKPFGAR